MWQGVYSLKISSLIQSGSNYQPHISSVPILYLLKLKSGRTRGQGRRSRQPKEQQPSDQAQTTQNVHWRPDYFAKKLFGTMKITPAIQRTLLGKIFYKTSRISSKYDPPSTGLSHRKVFIKNPQTLLKYDPPSTSLSHATFQKTHLPSTLYEIKKCIMLVCRIQKNVENMN